MTLLATALFSLTVSTIYFTSALDIILNPSLKWWNIPIRYQKNIPVWIKLSGEKFFLENTFDISKNGVFISEGKKKETHSPDNNYTNNISLGDLVTLSIPIRGENDDFQCKAEVIRKTDGKGNYPEGVGFRFLDLHVKDKLFLRKIINRNEISYAQ